MASGDTLLVLPAIAGIPPSAAGATIDTRNGHVVYDFDADTDESLIFGGLVMPARYSGGGITVLPHVTFTSAVTNEARVDVAFERVAGQDIDSDGFASAQSADITANGTSGIETIGSVAFTDGAQMDSVVAGDAFRLKITRDANHANDDATGDMELWSVVIKET